MSTPRLLKAAHQLRCVLSALVLRSEARDYRIPVSFSQDGPPILGHTEASLLIQCRHRVGIGKPTSARDCLRVVACQGFGEGVVGRPYRVLLQDVGGRV